MATTLVSLEEYLRTNYEPDMEYVDGALIRRNVGTFLHGLLQTLVAVYLSQFRKSHQISIVTEARLYMSNTGRHRIPDIMVLERPHGRGRVVTDVPAAVIEVKSPDDTFDEVIEKCLEYNDFGIPNIVVLDPDHKRQYVFTDRALRLVAGTVLTLPKRGTSLEFPIDELFAELDY
jgi:Uma2 family endonuclease